MKQVGRLPSTGLLVTTCSILDSYTPNEHGGLQGTDRAVTTCSLPPQPWKGTMHSPVAPYPSTTLAYTETTQIPQVPDPTDRWVKDLGTPDGTMNRHLNLALIPIIYVI